MVHKLGSMRTLFGFSAYSICQGFPWLSSVYVKRKGRGKWGRCFFLKNVLIELLGANLSRFRGYYLTKSDILYAETDLLKVNWSFGFFSKVVKGYVDDGITILSRG